MKILIVEDDPDLAEGLTLALRNEGFAVSAAANGAQAKMQLNHFQPDIAVLDLGLPDLDGMDLLKHIRTSRPTLPVLILTARGDTDNKVRALDSGADDYLPKPFEMAELLARLRVLGRRVGTADSSKINIGSVTLDTVAHTLHVAGKPVTLPRKEYMTLKILMEEAGRVKTKAMLENSLYDWGEVVGSNTIEVHISNLRKKLPQDFINTIRGVGYTIRKLPAAP